MLATTVKTLETRDGYLSFTAESEGLMSDKEGMDEWLLKFVNGIYVVFSS